MKLTKILKEVKKDIRVPSDFSYITSIFQEQQGSYYKFEAYSMKYVKQDKIENLQRKLGYDPAGYGFYDYKFERLDINYYVYKWSCSKSA